MKLKKASKLTGLALVASLALGVGLESRPSFPELHGTIESVLGSRFDFYEDLKGHNYLKVTELDGMQYLYIDKGGLFGSFGGACAIIVMKIMEKFFQ